MERPEYPLKIRINNKTISSIVIDQHYKINHPELNDELILELIKELDGKNFEPETMRNEFQYFKAEPIFLDSRPYRVIFLLCIGEDFLGVVNAFRVRG